jgi:hypothetical protein
MGSVDIQYDLDILSGGFINIEESCVNFPKFSACPLLKRQKIGYFA